MSAATTRSIVAFLFSLSIIIGFFIERITEEVFGVYATLILGYFFGKSDTKDDNPDPVTEAVVTSQSISQLSSIDKVSSISTPLLNAGLVRGILAVGLMGGVIWGFIAGVLPATVFVNFAGTAMGYYFGKDKDLKTTPDIKFKDRTLTQKDIDDDIIRVNR
jgi:hypothetical protein